MSLVCLFQCVDPLKYRWVILGHVLVFVFEISCWPVRLSPSPAMIGLGTWDVVSVAPESSVWGVGGSTFLLCVGVPLGLPDSWESSIPTPRSCGPSLL